MKIFRKIAALAVSFAFAVCTFSVPLSVSAQSANTITLRIEGATANILNETATFSSGEKLYSVFERELNSHNITYDAPSSTYGHMINTINGENAVYPVWWHIYVNNAMAEVGIDDITPKSGDNVVIYIGDDSNVVYPTFKFTPATPVAGETVTVNVSSSYDDYSNYPDVSTITENISGVKLTLGSKTYITDSDGNATMTVPTDGDFHFSAVKETKDATHAIVRMPSVGATVNPVVNPTPTLGTFDSALISTIKSEASNYLLNNSDFLSYNDSLALAAIGKTVPTKYAENVRDSLEDGGILYPTNIAGMIIGLKAAGYNPENFDGKNLVSELYSNGNIGLTGLNGYTYSLLALDCGNYKIPSSTKISRDSLIKSILSYQKSNGAFALDKDSSADCDMTAIAITALSPYMSDSRVSAAVNKAISFLSGVQKSDGGFVPSYSKNESSETISQVIIALASADVDPYNDTRFKKNGKTPLDALVSFKNSDGGFSHIKGYGSDDTATAQALQAIAAYENFVGGVNAVFDLNNLNSIKVLAAKVENPNTSDKAPYAALALISCCCLLIFASIKKKK